MAQTLAQLDNSEYAVGWIAALTNERAAAEAMLDKEHAPPQHKHTNDDNIYSLGSINGPNGEHNVVIACLPPGRYGTTPAATAAAQMLSSFPAIKFGLMVGIGGGIPSYDNDIRLGDVVFSKPEGTFGSVRQYNYRKATAHGFEECSALNSPPRVLLNAMGALENKHEKRGTAIPTILKTMYKDYPLMAKPREGPGYTYQGPNYDRLFKPDYEHVNSKRDCSEYNGAKEVDRQKRSDQDPYIHYGTIASGNQLIKYARERDLISKNCLCFETEAAGLMNDFPYLVIRGICDYADTHKNDRWQRYAAATAAAYAKELLQITDAADVKSTPEAREIIHQCAGKTIISSLVIDGLEKHVAQGSKIGLGYIYCDYRDRKDQTTENILGAILKQLLMLLPEIPKAVLKLYAGRVSQGKPLSLTDTVDLLGIACAQFSKVYVCLDALDELENLRDLLKQLHDSPRSIKIFITGRHNVQVTIQEYLTEGQTISIEAQESDIRRFIEYEIGRSNDIIPRAMNARLRKDILKKVVDSAEGVFILPMLQIRSILEVTTIRHRDKALKILPLNLNDTFVGTMSRVEQQSTELFNQAAKTIAWIHLAERPLTVNELLCSLAIEDSDTSLEPNGIPFIETLLDCCHGLTVVDQETSTVRLFHYSLQEYLSWQDRILGFTKEEWHMKIAHTCLTFLKFPSVTAGEAPEQNSSAVTLLFYAATQWGHHLRRSDHSSDAAMELAKEYLHTGLANNLESLRLLYKAMYSYGYTERLLDDVLPAHIVAFFGIPAIMSYLILTARNLDSKDPKYGRTPLWWAAENGHEAVVKLLLATGKVDADSKDRDSLTPLWRAARNGHEAVVKLLLATGKVDADSKDRDSRTPLWRAAENGHEAVVKLLLATGKVDADSKDVFGRTPLWQAAGNGHEAVVKLLLATGKVDVDSKDVVSRTPLWRAAGNGHEAVVKLLLATGKVDADSKDRDGGRTPLWRAAGNEHEAVVKLLLATGKVDADSKDSDGETPLWRAARNGHEAVVKLLQLGSE